MQTNILGPKKAPYVNTLTDLEKLTKKEKAILLAAVQNYYGESIHRIALALGEPHGEDELAFLASVLTQFYHKVGAELPDMLLHVANMEIPIVDETTNLVLLFLMQINRGFRGINKKEIPEKIKDIAERNTLEIVNELHNLNSKDHEHLNLANLADELSKFTLFSLAIGIYEQADKVETDINYIDRVKWENAKIFDAAYQVGVLLKPFNENLPEIESELLNQLHQVTPLHHIEIKAALRKNKREHE